MPVALVGVDPATMIAPAVGAALRARNVLQTPAGSDFLAPGVLLFTADGVLLSANLEARSWLGEIFGPETGESWATLLGRCSMPEQLMQYPLMHSLVARARAVARGHDEGPARFRLRDRGGRWIVLHASCLDEPDDTGPVAVAVVVEPAKSAEIAPIIVEGYGLSPRERDVVLIARLFAEHYADALHPRPRELSAPGSPASAPRAGSVAG